MASHSNNLGKTFLWGWCLALGLLLWGVSGCKSAAIQDEGLRNDKLSDSFRKARISRNQEYKDGQDIIEDYDPWLSENANRIKHNLQ
jgi:hypothetical protein